MRPLDGCGPAAKPRLVGRVLQSCCVVVLAVVSVSLLADIAPTNYAGANSVPVDNADVRMEHADVRIVWGIPCELRATFVLNNESEKAVELEIGFPVGEYRMGDPDVAMYRSEKAGKPLMEDVEPSVFSIVIDGQPSKAYHRMPYPHLREFRRYAASWYFTKATLNPGPNTIQVVTGLNAAGIYGRGCSRKIQYCIWTGGKWKGPIGCERVELVFPDGIPEGMIESVKPEGGLVAGRSVVWEFNDIEPTGFEYDIELRFVFPRFAAQLAEMRDAYRRDPDGRSALRYAAHLFLLGNSRANEPYTPSELSAAEVELIKSGIHEEKARSSFMNFFRKDSAGGFRAVTSGRTPEGSEIIQILADAGYNQRYDGDEKVGEARRIVEAYLQRNPRDADGWHLYLAEFWRFSFAARSHWHGRTVVSVPFRKAVEQALQHCPDDPRVRAWGEGKRVTPAYEYEFEFTEPEPPEMPE